MMFSIIQKNFIGIIGCYCVKTGYDIYEEIRKRKERKERKAIFDSFAYSYLLDYHSKNLRYI